jgi:CBS domain containing-hemolysin-like protein
MTRQSPWSALARAIVALALTCGAVEPSFAASEFIDKAASVLAIFIIIAVPIGGIVLFWLVHILPEKVAEKRHHPQKDAIQVLCLLSLVFGGLLWPLAWLWAYSKPVFHKMAYGRDRHDDYYAELEAEAGEAPALALHEELGRLRHEVEALEKRPELTDALKGIREQLAKLESRSLPAPSSGGER